MVNNYEPKVSIIVAAYNAEKTIKRCIDALLDMNYPDFDIIVVDNNSKDGTAKIVREYVRKYSSVTYLFEAKKGWPAARNAAIRYAETDFVANIDADCFATQEWLKNLIAGFTSDDIGCIVGKTIVEPGQTLAQQYFSSPKAFNIEHHIGVNPYVPWGGGNNVFLRKVFLEAGGYNDEEFTSGADAEFHARMEKMTGYKTVYQERALIYHVARGSLREFFAIQVKYAHDGYKRSRMLPEIRPRYSWYISKKVWNGSVNLAAFFYRLIKFVYGNETKLRLVSPLFNIVRAFGAIYGNLRGKLRMKPDRF
ncbi:MAG: glycosyltransferase [Candidatus Scalinduaceae bacterium]